MSKGILKPFEVSEDEVGRLGPTDLVMLIKRLVEADLQQLGAPVSAVHGTLKINVPDGGEDISVAWSKPSSKPGVTDHYFTVYQVKAEKLTDDKLRSEPIEANGKRLKPAVAEVLARRGKYIIVTSKTNLTKPKKGSQVRRRTEVRSLLHSAIREIDERVDHAHLDVYGPVEIAGWVNAHPMVAVWMKQLLGQASADFAFQTMENWSCYRDLSNALVSWPSFSGQSDTIQQSLLKPRKVIRLLGHAGLGKSRLAFEALRSGGAACDLAPIVAYARKYSPSLIHQVRDFIQNRRRVVLVVDDCPPSGHRELSQEVHRTDSLLSMITLDLDFDKPPPEDQEIVIDAAPKEGIKEILKSSGVVLPPEDLERATEFCSGFPLIAVLVAAGLKSGAEHFADFQDPENLTSKLVWGEGPIDADLLRCLRCISLFKAVGIIEPKDVQIKWIAENLLEMTAGQLEARLERFFARRILQRRGYSILVRPRPLAAQLAAAFWRDATNDQRKSLLEGSMPDELKEALCDRLSDLNYLADARGVAAKLCGSSGPFGSAKALNTDVGARCLRRLAEVAPEDVVTTLDREFGSLDLPTLKEAVGPGRRWLVWTLDALAWEPSVFQWTMCLLLRLAAAENETWSNNATGEFVQRFRVQLPGTSASLAERLDTLKFLIGNAEDGEYAILVSALCTAIDAHAGTRTIGSENHGTRKTYEDYQPKTWSEIFVYARGVLDLLKAISQRSEDAFVVARQAFAAIDASMLISEPMFADYKALVEFLKPERETWGQLLEHLSWQLNYRLNDEEDADARERVAQLFTRLLPTSLEERILFYVKSVLYHFRELDSEEHDYDQNSSRAADLGKECAHHWSIFEKVVGPLSEGETRQGFAFGQSFLEATDKPFDAIQLATKSLEVAERQNQSLLGGMINALFVRDRQEVYRLLTRVSKAPLLRKFLPYFAALNLTPESLNLVIDLIDRGDLAPDALSIFGMGGVLQPMPTSEVKRLMNSLVEQGEQGAWIAVDLLSMYMHGDKTKFGTVREEIDRAVRAAPFASTKSNVVMDNHHYETLVKMLLGDLAFGPSLAKFLAEKLIGAVQDRRASSNDLLQKLTELVMVRYSPIVLPMFAAYIEQADQKDRWHFTYILGSPFSFSGKVEGPLFRLGTAAVVAACKAYPKNFARMVAEMAPLFTTNDGRKKWTELGSALLNEFGSRKDIQDALSINISTGGWSGPTSAHLRSFVSPLEELKDHPVRQVRSWARERLKILNAQVESELRDEEEVAVRRG
ncbi:hypothetical protein [Bradyrhizobium japonicum]|uniref:hypothetical protein n=1 Tax=Bradyrhizobium japonicum TaxID=375 RepID=UPI0012FE08E5|nr:hypothetical protein [Bradyrhizobium japonicum]